jgi:P2 family phage contractile tail tube protein
MALPKVLANFNLIVDGQGFLGEVTELTPATLAVTTEEYRGGGLDSPVPYDVGLEPIEVSFSMASYNVELLKLFGLADGNAVQVTFKGGLRGQGQDAAAISSVTINARGMMRELAPEAWQAGQRAPVGYTIRCRYYRVSIDGEDVIEIDVDNMKRIIGGVDQLAAIRQAIGA